MLYVGNDIITDEPDFFEEHPRIFPKGVVINNVIYPFLDETESEKVDPNNRYKRNFRLKKQGVVFPTIDELKPLAEHFAEYAAIAECFGLRPFESCVIENNQSTNDVWTHFYDLVENKEDASAAPCPYFTIKKVS